MDRLLLVCLGGALGTVLRYLAGVTAARWWGPEFPYGTLIVNLVGSFLIGLVNQIAGTVFIGEQVRLFLTVGVMGGLTTYSAFAYETVRLLETGATVSAWMNVVVTTTLCLALCACGMRLARALAGV
jgi:CrcB protein